MALLENVLTEMRGKRERLKLSGMFSNQKLNQTYTPKHMLIESLLIANICTVATLVIKYAWSSGHFGNDEGENLLCFLFFHL